MKDEDYAGLLKTLTETAAETGNVSIDRALRTGRRTVRRRRVAGVLAVAALIAAAGLSPLLLNSVSRSSEPVAPAPTATATTGDFNSGQEVGSEFDLWSQAFELGPTAGFTPTSYLTGLRWQQIRLKPPPGEAGKGSEVQMTLYAEGIEPQIPAGFPSREVNSAVAPINGRPATANSIQDGVILIWKYSDNAWGTVTMTGRGPAVRVDRIRHLAEAVRHLDHGRPLSVPFTVSQQAVGTDLRLIGVWSSIGSADIRLVLDDQEWLAPSLDGPRIWAGVAKPAPAITANTSIDGRPARVDAAAATILDTGEGYASLAAVSLISSFSFDPAKVARSIKLVPNAGDQRNWITDPLR
jgi:hypothetical protein